jgi:type VI secretion system secreted protein Hcp
MNIDGIPGESKDAKHKSWIDVFSFHHGATRPMSKNWEAMGPIQCEEFMIVKASDMSSTKLLSGLLLNQRIKSVKIEVCYKGGTNDGKKLMEYILSDAVVSSFRIRAETGGGTAAPLEEVTFNYLKFECSYYAIDEKGISKLAGTVLHELKGKDTA